jgi:transcriptional regulator with XRE-family HTH domain
MQKFGLQARDLTNGPEMRSSETPASLTEGQLLRNWFSRQSNWRSWRALADALALPYSSLKKYIHGRPIRIPEHRAKIYRLTGIDAYRTDSPPARKDTECATPSEDDDQKRKLAIRLRQWLSQQGKFRSIAEMARSLGIAESTLRDYFIGRALPTPKNLTILREVTQLSVLDDILKAPASRRREQRKTGIGRDGKSFLIRLDAVMKSFSSLSEELESFVREAERQSATHSREPADQTSSGRARTITNLLARLKGELEFFKAGSAEDREAFRQAIPGDQLGYVVSLLKALCDEDTFREWLHFSQLDLTEKR